MRRNLFFLSLSFSLSLPLLACDGDEPPPVENEARFACAAVKTYDDGVVERYAYTRDAEGHAIVEERFDDSGASLEYWERTYTAGRLTAVRYEGNSTAYAETLEYEGDDLVQRTAALAGGGETVEVLTAVEGGYDITTYLDDGNTIADALAQVRGPVDFLGDDAHWDTRSFDAPVDGRIDTVTTRDYDGDGRLAHELVSRRPSKERELELAEFGHHEHDADGRLRNTRWDVFDGDGNGWFVEYDFVCEE
jgi:hypothetical protein